MSETRAAHRGASLPPRFLEVRVSDLTLPTTLRAVCVGYEAGKWREQQLAEHLIEWLLDFALDPVEVGGVGSHNAVRLLRRAAHRVYTSEKYQRRGEFGEILLHALLRQECRTIPAISKIYFKTSSNDTVKGFDAVHVVGENDDLELWLGEAKFYDDRARAIGDVLAEIEEHLKRDYLRSEFLTITAMLSDSHPHASTLKKLLDPNTSLDRVFTRLCVPMMITYDSRCVSGHSVISEEYNKDFGREALDAFEDLADKLSKYTIPTHVRLHALLVPLRCKSDLVKIMDGELKRWQTRT